ncbi:hypothetical protein [Mesorhizobium sp. M7A.F.Ca.CA.002.12.1.1]|uniref:hypothetical protein n=1 Tax=Mesorhizobium sp. M7A.F.Ca.CA.002.12.1.1 TaxID=2496735 RepID=UPI000FCB93CF|nr:hypothetical protein [Mesorhizobium sp. M7A.F.Ca.CA.002.12.1.1]RUX60154.1 hypothetical protein EN989_11085 [Mesorhizobium sp. M7A.F.Ca.CA.002.12.1.1]
MVRYYPADRVGLDSKAPTQDPIFEGNPQAPTPTAGDSDQSIATTGFVQTQVDNAIATIPIQPDLFKQSCYVATVENITLSGEQLIDGKVTSNSRVLVKDQIDGTKNGLWQSAVGAWSRVSDADESPEVMSGMLVFVENGYLNGGLLFVCANKGVIDIGTSNLSFVRVIPQQILFTGKVITDPLHTLTGSDINRRLDFTYESEKTLMVMPNDIAEIPIDSTIKLLNMGLGKLIITAGADVIVKTYRDALVLRQYETATLEKVGYPNTWVLSGSYAEITGNPNDPAYPSYPGDPVAGESDIVPPATPTGLVVESVVEQLENGQQQVRLIASCDINAELDLASYTFEVKQAAGAYVGFITNTNRYEWVIKPGVLYTVRARATDKSGNHSGYTDPVEHVAAKDTIPPAIPTDLEVIAGLSSLWISWNNPNDSDLSHVEVYENTLDDSTTATLVDKVFGEKLARTGLDTGVTRFYWLQAVDTSGNLSGLSPVVSGTTGSIPEESKFVFDGVVFTPNDGAPDRLTWSAGNISYGQPGEEPVTNAISAGFLNWTDGTMFIYYVKDATELAFADSLVTVFADHGTVMAVYKGDENLTITEGNAYVSGATGPIDGSLIIAQTIGANQLVADEAVITGSIQIADAIITDAKIVSLDATKITTGFLDADRIEAGSITADKVTISGATTLADWRKGGDETRIDGQEISAGTVSAEKLVIGNRNVKWEGLQFEHNSPAANQVSWTAGKISYIGDDGNIFTRNVVAGNATWSTGTLYLYWVKDATTIQSSTSIVTAMAPNAIVLAAYKGGTDLVTEYGRTIIDGSKIKTGSIVAAQIAAGAITGAKIAAGSISASKMVISNSSNMLPDGDIQDPSAWTDLPAGAAVSLGPSGFNGSTGVILLTPPVAISTTTQVFGSQLVPVLVGDQLFISAESWHSSTLAASTALQLTYYDLNKAILGGTNFGSRNDSVAGLQTHTLSYTVPPGVRYVSIRGFAFIAPTGMSIGFGSFFIRKKQDGNLIVDGAITATQLAAGSVTADKLTVGTSGNMLENTDHAAGTTGYVLSTSVPADYTSLGVRPTDIYTPYGGSLQLSQLNASTSHADLIIVDTAGGIKWWPCFPGQRFELSSYAAAHRCQMQLYIQWLDSAGATISYSTTGMQNVLTSGTGSLTGYTRMLLFGTAPAGAVRFRPFFRKGPTLAGQTDSYGWWTRMFLGEAQPNQTQATPWSVGGVTKIGPGNISTTSLSAISANVGTLNAGTVQSTDGKVVFSLTNARLLMSDNT